MAIILVLAASLAGALVNLLTKKNQDRIGAAQGYLVIYFLCSLVFAFLIHFSRYEHVSWPMFSVGVFAGVLNFLLMVFVTQALKFGPPGLTFAFQNASAILPSVLLFALFGPAFQFHLPPTLIIGLCLVVIGLFVGIRFGGADERVKAFDGLIADIQWASLPIVVTDEQAKAAYEAFSKSSLE